MNWRLLVVASCVPLALSAQGSSNRALPAAAPAAAPAADIANPVVTPWDLYLACHALTAPAAAGDGPALPPGEAEKARAVCGLTLPRLGTRFAGVERNNWQNALAGLPHSTTWTTLRTLGEKALLERLDLLGQISIGGQLLRFEYGVDDLSRTQIAEVRALAEQFRTALMNNPAEFITVTGYADNDKSGEEVNRRQALRRAEAIVNELALNGIDRTRIRVATHVVQVRAGADSLPAARAAGLHVGDSPATSLDAGTASGVARPGAELGVSGLLIGTTDFLLDEAREQIESYLLRQGALRICAKDQGWADLLRATCALVPDAASASVRGDRMDQYVPGLETLREGIRDDLRALPYRVGQNALAGRLKQGGGSLDRDKAALALYLFHYVERLAQAESPVDAISQAADELTRNGLQNANLESLEAVKAVRRAAMLARTVNSARSDLRATWGPEALPDSIALYTLRALAVNARAVGAPAEFPNQADAFARQLDDVLTGIRSVQALVSSIETGWAELRAAGQDSASAWTRRARVAQILGDAVDLAFTGFVGSTGKTSEFRRFAAPVRELTTAVAAGDAPAMMSNLLEVSRFVDSGGILERDQLRVLAFATDVTEARQSDQVKAAFERLVGDGPGYVGKRTSTERFWRVNAYVGVSGGIEYLVDADDVEEPLGGALGFTVPIGVELGWPYGGSGSHGLLVQLVDLGAIASARIGNNGDVESFPEFGFGAVVAPGLYYVHSLGSSPVSILAGFAYLPQARVSETDKEAGGLRATVSLAVDVPLFP